MHNKTTAWVFNSIYCPPSNVADIAKLSYTFVNNSLLRERERENSEGEDKIKEKNGKVSTLPCSVM